MLRRCHMWKNPWTFRSNGPGLNRSYRDETWTGICGDPGRVLSCGFGYMVLSRRLCNHFSRSGFAMWRYIEWPKVELHKTELVWNDMKIGSLKAYIENSSNLRNSRPLLWLRRWRWTTCLDSTYPTSHWLNGFPSLATEHIAIHRYINKYEYTYFTFAHSCKTLKPYS